jgi:hypothetical protein
MQPWIKTEKRKTPRFEIDIPVSVPAPQFDTPIVSRARDISAYGLGTTVPLPLPLGTVLDVVLMMPEKEDQVRLRGTVIWIKSTASDTYRVGIRFLADHFNPIPCVLKTLQHKAMARFPNGHAYPA